MIMGDIRKFKIGIFDSGIGGLTVYKEIQSLLPQYDYLYLGDNGRAPYGNKSFEAVYKYTLECVNWMIKQGAHLIILACNTASARALRSIQMNDWEEHLNDKRILGVIRPTVEYIPQFSKTKHIGVVATKGTVSSQTYPIEFNNIDPEIIVTQKSCPLWVPLIENNQKDAVTKSVVRQDLEALFESDPQIDSLLLGCTHYPHIYDIIREITPQHITIYSQGHIVAQSLANYLNRHSWLESQLSLGTSEMFYTTDDVSSFMEMSKTFLERDINVHHLPIDSISN